jgi:hypothetical protein
MAESPDARSTRHQERGRRGTKSGASRYGNTVKKSVTLRENVVDEIEARTGPGGFSEFIDAAAERYLAMLKAQDILADHVKRHGEFTAEELAEAQAAWRGE